jgi:hypothetical protein
MTSTALAVILATALGLTNTGAAASGVKPQTT